MTRPRVALLIQNRENCRLLADWLGARFDVIVPDDRAIPQAPFDLCILDGPTLEASGAAVRARKDAEAPAFLPFLFVTMRKDLRLVTRTLYRSVDELIFMPIEKVELDARLEILLRARASSVELKRRNDELFTALVEQSLVGVYLARDGQYLYMNAAGAEIFGRDPRAIVAGLGPLDLAHPEDRPRVAAELRRLDRGEAATAHFTFRGMRPDGARLECEVFERTVTHEGEPVRLGTVLDITERRLLEEERARSHETALATLRRADTLKDEFLSILSHELRTPINAIMGFGSIMEDELAGPLTGLQREYLHKMMVGSDALLALVNDLLDMSRIQAGKFTVQHEAVDLGAAARDVVAALAPLAAKKGHDVTVAIDPDLPAVDADSQRAGQVLTNLVGNAIKFTPPGGRIRISARHERGHVLCEVADTGIGISREDQQRLFQRFGQLDTSATRQGKGTGLGLSICKAIVEALDGTIGVRSEAGKGSTFWFTLPVLDGR